MPNYQIEGDELNQYSDWITYITKQVNLTFAESPAYCGVKIQVINTLKWVKTARVKIEFRDPVIYDPKRDLMVRRHTYYTSALSNDEFYSPLAIYARDCAGYQWNTKNIKRLVLQGK